VPHAIALARRLRAEGARAVFEREPASQTARVIQVRGPLDGPSALLVDGQETTLAALLRQAVGR